MTTFTKDTKTALIIMPPKELWDQIQAIRSTHDSAYIRWMPHVNLLFPFVTESQFPDAEKLLIEQIAKDNIKEFEIEFTDLSFFVRKKSTTLFLDPSNKDDMLQNIYNSIIKVFPNLPTRDQFTPHLTLGNSWNTEKDVKEARDNFQKIWKTIKFTVDSIHLISRQDKDDPFKIITSVKLNK